MKAVMLMFDSLNRHLLPPYCDGDGPAHAPNFARLARHSATFERSYVCSMPCMPARRDFHNARPNFLHHGWGPLEPFDDSVPRMLREAGVYTHLATDHYHYFENGGGTYHTQYSSYESFRGQEGDLWIGQVEDPEAPKSLNGKGRRQDWVNRPHLQPDENHSQTLTLDAGLRFIERNHHADRWMLQIECFDPHEPFFCDPKYREHYPSDYDGPLFDWPGYKPADESPEQVAEARNNYLALLTKCDESLGRLLDSFDQHGLWEDTMLIVCTDHGFMLAEHGCWAKNWMPLYEEVSHTPFFIHDPRRPEADGQRRSALVQPALDMGPTLLNFFGLSTTGDMVGCNLAASLADDTAVRETAVFGYHGNRINITDGRYVLYRAGDTSAACYRYTLMPTTMRGFIGNLPDAELHPPRPYSKAMPLLRVPTDTQNSWTLDGVKDQDLLFDLEQDPQQQRPIEDDSVTQRLCRQMAERLAEGAAPPELFARLRLDEPAAV